MIYDRSFMAETANNHIMLAPPLICQAKESLHDVEDPLFKRAMLRKAMTKLCIKILVEADSAIESVFPYIYAFLYFFTKRAMRLSASAIFSRLAA